MAALGAPVLGAAYVGLRTAFDDDFDLYNVGAARFVQTKEVRMYNYDNELYNYRFGRAALTVASISVDYRRSIYTKEADNLYESNRTGRNHGNVFLVLHDMISPVRVPNYAYLPLIGQL